MTSPSNLETDSSSYASVLAGVKRMREMFESDQVSDGNSASILKRDVDVDESTAKGSNDDKNNDYGSIKEVEITDKVTDQSPKGNTNTNTDVASRGGANSYRNPPPMSTTYTRIQVSPSQKGNPLLVDSHLKTTAWEYNSTIVSDYVINPKLQFLFLSLKYHKLHPEYLWQRIKKLNKGSTNSSILSADDSLRILLVVVDVDSHQEIIRNLSNFCVRQDLSMVLAWTFEEAGNYIYHAKKQELSATRQTTSIKRAREEDYESRIRDTLVSIRAINKTDSVNLLGNFKSFENIVQESVKVGGDLGKVHGFGNRKIDNMRQVFSEPFIYNREYVTK
ncbi:hypothetical protein CLIB1423_39S00364 [[Candida] railenensis]|uniref:ERCC1-like central domain-containing protein n=1 Tax=[Candida] railenensis TaxID=45579 RepID=A0A9P0W1T5_9ASCO|nr:hypothetical protein CLIB1423_39S00364 [[Candida] railenensis]